MEGLALGKKPIIIPIPADLNQSTMARCLSNYSVKYAPLDTLTAEHLAADIENSAKPEDKDRFDFDQTFLSSNGTRIAARKILELVKNN